MDWEKALLAYLHDPPDKALSIRGHEPRARDNAQIVIGDYVSRKILKSEVSIPDLVASMIERLPMPKAGEEGIHAVGPENSSLRIVHPLSATPKDLQVPELDEEMIKNEHESLSSIIPDLPGEGNEQFRNRFFAIWRLWPENVDKRLRLLPADTRIPDHTIWNHLDTTAAFMSTHVLGQGSALLAFALGPVQQFIEASRSVRDLWSSSMILSWLSFRAMLPIIEQLGPTALIYPALRGNPTLDAWLRRDLQLGDKIPQSPQQHRLTPLLPHRFLAIVPWGVNGTTAFLLASECRNAMAGAWQEIADAVKQRLQQKMDSLSLGWDKLWETQIKNYFSASTAVLPLEGAGDEIDMMLARLLDKANQTSFGKAFKEAEAIRKLAGSIPASDRPTYEQDHAGRWQYQVELVMRSLAAHRSIRNVPITDSQNANERYPEKCTLLGSFEQMGPSDLRESRNFWDRAADSSIEGVRIRKGEALCAVAMVKRFAGLTFLAKELDVTPDALRFMDTWSIAAREWLNCAGIDPFKIRKNHGNWNGQWLHWKTEHDDPDEPECPVEVLRDIKAAQDKYGKPPIYYAILKLDGDDLGGWLRGEKSPMVRDVMHPKLVAYYEALGKSAKAGLDVRRPVGPALHAAISTALSNFALHVVPAVVNKHYGTVIYSGGDDTLVLLPASRTLTCALELNEAYGSDWLAESGKEYLMMGHKATISGGLAVVHAKDDLRLGLRKAREAEKQAKKDGKDALRISICRRSGEHTSALCPWSSIRYFDKLREHFVSGASTRWAYHLFKEQPTLEALPVEAIMAEMKRQLGRAESPTRELIPPDDFIAAFDVFRESLIPSEEGTSIPRFKSMALAFEEFLTLCQTAAFLARGRD